jgi:UDPglucose 6-dehydrogenase
MKNIGIIGNGFVGSAIAAGFALHAKVRVFDKDQKKSIDSLFDVVNFSDIVFVSVPTPMTHVEGGKIDLKIMDSVFDEIVSLEKLDKFSFDDVIFVIKSTVTPGTTARYQQKYPGLRIVFNPEFLTERSARLDFINASRIVLGGHDLDVDTVEELYIDRFPHTKIIKTDSGSAEFIKYMCNTFFATKLSFMNEMYIACNAFGGNWSSVMDGFMADGRIGNSHVDVPGHDGDFGYGGKCFPKDINAFIGFFESIGVEPTILNASWERNLSVRTNYDWAKIKGAVSEGEN